ncbi:hypothetical protein TG4357_02221 [Thalassovita gelatinovora]|uniref:DUF6455 domain-containing protein n=1 Tax=Thalassovita gelatinovora TaxID=53501 RepID=A0A0P1FD05_THAGE|nr:DUF6455 family protein [Thalassovita gelatinovora]QIZ80569.1 hypothetical protein HFZ77_08770 [Thalassovita gelatinovora]CUH66076.1 hypothetical protein TG4357_02221 [Thalassovita gelatinovora]SEQ76461.1 hypothetical protein SAMN04488043_108170 [Thalassovita gelatinovora]
MGIFKKISHHADVMDRMAETMGADFASRIQADPAVAYQYRSAVMRCSSCKHDAECSVWMDHHSSASQTPRYCRNKDLLEALSEH